jgi:hypothetical protein
VIDAKLKGEGIDISEPEEPDRSNVVDLMAALKKSLDKKRLPRKSVPLNQPRERSRSVLPLRQPSQDASGRKLEVRHRPATVPGGSAHRLFDTDLAEELVMLGQIT